MHFSKTLQSLSKKIGQVLRIFPEVRNRVGFMRFSRIWSEKKKREIELGKVAPGSQEDIISTFLVLRDENRKPPPEEEMIDNFITLVFASHDTTTIVLSMFTKHLARNLKIRSKY